jgi:hypothetical protein
MEIAMMSAGKDKTIQQLETVVKRLKGSTATESFQPNIFGYKSEVERIISKIEEGLSV